MAKRQTPNAKRRIPGVILSVLGIAYCFWLLGLALAQPAANTPPPDFSPQVFEIARELRCPVCQGESVAESNAGISQEMRRIIAEQLAQGKNKEQIKAYFVSRYGPWILYEPPRAGLTLWVWLAPLVGVGLIGAGLYFYLQSARRRSLEAGTAEVSEEELRRAEAELDQP